MTDSLANPVQHCPHLRLEQASHRYPEHQIIDDLPLVIVDSPLCQASIAVQGAQLLDFIPRGGQPMLWLSPAARFQRGKPLRGGIPLCLPWFGSLVAEPDKPAHGFVREEDWQLTDAQLKSDNTLQLDWLHDRYSSRPAEQFNWRFSTRLTMSLGTRIELQLSVTNCDDSPMPLTWALHSYHPVSDLQQVTILGLQGLEYLDKTRGMQRYRQTEAISIDGEFDRIYLDVPEEQTVVTQPALHIRGDNCRSAIVWNPGPERAAAMADLGAGSQRQFICLERGNAADNWLTVAPGHTHTARVCIANTDSRG